KNADCIGILEEDICDLILSGYSANEVAAILNQQHGDPDNMQELIGIIQGLLDERYSKNDIVNIIVNNKESEEFFSQKNFWAKIKNRYFVVKVIVSVSIATYLCYLLYQYFYNNKKQGFG